jgi:hypothetical protein
MMAQSKSAISHSWIFVAGSSSEYWGQRGENMELGYDIFRELGDGSPLWVTHAPSLKEAREKLDTLARTLPADYFLRDATNAKIIARVSMNTSEETRPGELS